MNATDKLAIGTWVTLDLTCFSKAKRHGYSDAQGVAVRVIGYRADRYTVEDANGFRFRALLSELSGRAVNEYERCMRIAAAVAARKALMEAAHRSIWPAQR